VGFEGILGLARTLAAAIGAAVRRLHGRSDDRLAI